MPYPHLQLNKEHENLLQSLNRDIEIVFDSYKWQRIKSKIGRIADTDSRVLILGSKGSGRELVARNIHALSSLSGNEFIVFSPRLFPSDEIERKLFNSKDSYFECAKGGTLFVSEVEYLPTQVQEAFAHLLSTKVLANDSKGLRLVTSGSQDLPELVRKGLFREDLYNRINSVSIEVPTLCESKSDIPSLANHIMKSLSISNMIEPVTFSKGAMEVLQNYRWPGNLNQFRSVLEYLLIQCSLDNKKVVSENDVPIDNNRAADNLVSKGDFFSFPIKRAREMFDKEYIKAQLVRFDNSVSKAALFMEMERTALYRKMKDLGISVSKKSGTRG